MLFVTLPLKSLMDNKESLRNAPVQMLFQCFAGLSDPHRFCRCPKSIGGPNVSLHSCILCSHVKNLFPKTGMDKENTNLLNTLLL